MARNLTLLTDLYQLTMAQGYWQQLKPGIEACFYMFFRDNPFKGGYAVSCGMDQVVELIEGFGFDDGDIDYLAGLKAPSGAPLFDEAFLEWLGGMELEVDIDAVPDGTVVFPREPLLRVTGPLMQCQLLETCILNGVNFQTLIATKAARVAHAAAGRGVAEFGLRRAQGPDGGLSGDRAAFVGGCGSVANVLAGKRYGIPVSGTHAHSWVMSFPDELSAFRAWVSSMPGNSTLLVDTYDVEQGVRNAITVGLEMRERGEHLFVRALDADEGKDLVRLFALDGVIVHENGAHQVRADLLDLIDRAHDVARLVGKPEHRVEAVQNAAVVDADLEALEAHRRKDVVDDGGDLGVVHDVQLAVADDVDIRLIELAEAAALRALAAVDLADLEAAEGEGELVVVQGDVLRQRHGQVKAQGEVAVALGEAVDLLFRFAAALGEQDLAGLDDGGIERGEAVAAIGRAQNVHHALHLLLLRGKQLHEA